jgi:hypothetical protein
MQPDATTRLTENALNFKPSAAPATDAKDSKDKDKDKTSEDSAGR